MTFAEKNTGQDHQPGEYARSLNVKKLIRKKDEGSRENVSV